MGIVIVVTFLILLVVLVVGTGIRLFDLDGRREIEAEVLQDRLTVVLRRELGEVTVIPVAYVSHSASTPDIVEVHGRVPSAEVRDAVLRTVGDELMRTRPGCQLNDRVEIAEEADVQSAAA